MEDNTFARLGRFQKMLYIVLITHGGQARLRSL
jgi:hypothetical protein